MRALLEPIKRKLLPPSSDYCRDMVFGSVSKTRMSLNTASLLKSKCRAGEILNS